MLDPSLEDELEELPEELELPDEEPELSEDVTPELVESSFVVVVVVEPLFVVVVDLVLLSLDCA